MRLTNRYVLREILEEAWDKVKARVGADNFDRFMKMTEAVK